MMTPRHCLLLVAVVAVPMSGCRTPQVESPRVELYQTVAGFDRPESCSVSLDGRHVFVSNCASGEYGPNRHFALARGRGAISKLAVSEHGILTMVDPRFVDGITAPLGQSPLPVATKRFPQGAIFVNTGFFMQTDAAGEYIQNSAHLQTGVSIFDAESGAMLGFIPLGWGSAVAGRTGAGLLVPNGLTFDAEGNRYIGETGGSNTITEPNMVSPGGVLRIDHAAIDVLADGGDHAGVRFVVLPGTNGVMFDPERQAILAVTCSGDPTADGVYGIPVADFGSTPAQPKILGLDPLDGIVRLPSGRYLCSTMTGGLLAANLQDRRAWSLHLPDGLTLESPSDIKLLPTADGKILLLVPEQEHLSPERWAQRLRVFRILE